MTEPMDFIASFEQWLERKDLCITCWSEGRLIATLPITGLKVDIECPTCHGTGKAPRSEAV